MANSTFPLGLFPNPVLSERDISSSIIVRKLRFEFGLRTAAVTRGSCVSARRQQALCVSSRDTAVTEHENNCKSWLPLSLDHPV